MEQVVSITSSGQLTIPKKARLALGIKGSTKAIIREIDGVLIVKPTLGFKNLSGSLGSKVKLTDKELREARNAFHHSWAD